MNYKTFLKSAQKRRTEILSLRLQGWTWAAIGKRFGITRQRAFQIGTK